MHNFNYDTKWSPLDTNSPTSFSSSNIKPNVTVNPSISDDNITNNDINAVCNSSANASPSFLITNNNGYNFNDSIDIHPNNNRDTITSYSPPVNANINTNNNSNMILLLIAIFMIIITTSKANSDTFPISADGSLRHLVNRQKSCESTPDVFCIKYRSAQALISIQNISANDDSTPVFYKADDKIAVFVGNNRWESLEGRRRSIEWIQNYERETGQKSLSAEVLGLGIANLAHEQSMYPSSTQQLLYNTIVMGSHRKEYINIQNNQTNDINSTTSEVVYVPCILRVDVSGNFYRCDATSTLSTIRNWLETKLYSLILNETDHTNTNSENNDILIVMGLAYHCIIDNYKEITTDAINTDNTNHIDIQIAFNGFDYNENQIIGPIKLSNQIFNTNITTDKNETQGTSIRHQGLRIWTFLKQSNLMS